MDKREAARAYWKSNRLLIVLDLLFAAGNCRVRAIYFRSQCVELGADTISIEEFFLEGYVTNAIVTASRSTQVETTGGLAEFNETFLAANLIGLEIRRNTVFGAGFSVLTESVAGIST